MGDFIDVGIENGLSPVWGSKRKFGGTMPAVGWTREELTDA